MEIETRDNIEFGRVGNRALEGILLRPPQASSKLLPIIVWIHGGAFMYGSRHDNQAIREEIASNGFACFSIDYRLSSEAIFPATIQDCKCAVRYLRAHATELGISTAKIGVWGPSAGGHLAAMLGTSATVAELEGEGGYADQSSAVQAVCDWFGPTDFSRMSAFPSDIDHDAPDSPESLLVGGPVQENPEKVQAANPISYVSVSTPSFYIAHGTADPLVPFNQSELLHKALVAQGVEVTFDVLENAGHGGAGFEADSLLVERCISFFKRHLI